MHLPYFQMFSDLFPLRDEQNQHDENFLKHHDEDVQDTLAQPGCALHWLSCTNIHIRRETDSGKFLLRDSDMQHRSLSDFTALELHKEGDTLQQWRQCTALTKNQCPPMGITGIAVMYCTHQCTHTRFSPYSPKRSESHCLHSTTALTTLTPAQISNMPSEASNRKLMRYLGDKEMGI